MLRLKAHWPWVLLLLISIALCFANYTPGTFLSGWDALHPEFNFGLNFERTLTGVFRVEQGLGAVAGHSHMVELPRIILLYLTHFVLPLDFLRYFYIFLNVILGTLGMYFFLEKHLLKDKTASFLGALFYLLNLGTMQIFNTPFEMFTTLFATIPFLFYYATSFLTEEKHRVRNLFVFTLWALLSSISAYAATLWYVFFACFFIYFVSFSLIRRKENKGILKHFAVLITVFVAVNLFWLIPNIYFVLNHGKEVQHANINRLFSDQAFLKNKEFGNLSDILLLKSFYFDWNIYQGSNSFTSLLLPFINYLKNIPVLILGYAFGLSFIVGAVVAFRKLKLKSLPFFLVLGFSLFFLINSNFPFGPVFDFFQSHVSFFKEALRFPDNKILNVFVFLMSIFFGYAALFVIEKLRKINLKAPPIFTLLVSILIILYALPSFGGNFINYYMRVEIPKQYFDLFNYLNNEPETLRVANLPIHSPWGWTYYDWYKDKPGFQGAGFLYFGIKQSLLDRDFDRWSPYNESYYREMSYAVYKGDTDLLKNVVNKYRIGFIFIDRSVIDPPNPESALYFAKSRDLLEKTGLIEEKKEFGKIEIFKLKGNTDIFTALNTNINVNPQTTTTYNDFAYSLFKNYITTNVSNTFTNVNFPFRDLIDNQSKLHADIATIDDQKITLNPNSHVADFKTSILYKNLNIIPSDLLAERNGTSLSLSIYPNTPVFDNTTSSSPLKGDLDIGNAQRNLSLSINQNELFNLGDLPQGTPVAIGKVLLKNGLNSISAFDTTLLTTIKDVPKIINPFFSSCKEGGNSPTAGFTENGIKVGGTGDICILIPYGFFPSEVNGQKANILTDLQFEFSGDAKITSCLFSQETSSCLYYRNPVRNGKIVSFPYALSSNEVNKRAIKIFIQPENTKKQNYVLDDLTSWYSKSVVDLNLNQNFVSDIFSNTENLSFNKIYLPKNITYDPGFSVTSLKKLYSDCNSPSDATKEIRDIDGIKTVKYKADTGSFCDHFSYQNLPHNQGYLIVFNSKNESGLPLTVCITNYTSRKCDIYSDLTPQKSFGKDVLLLPPMDKDGIGYDVNIENLGIKGSPSINYLSSIEFIPVPFEFLDNIQTSNVSSNTFTGKIEKVTQKSPLSYVVETDGKPMLLAFYRSYENGFKAYAIDCNGTISCFIAENLAPLIGKEITNHVLVDNWANGWEISAKRVKIVFLPQYLEYFGLVLILGVISAILYKVNRQK